MGGRITAYAGGRADDMEDGYKLGGGSENIGEGLIGSMRAYARGIWEAESDHMFEEI